MDAKKIKSLLGDAQSISEDIRAVRNLYAGTLCIEVTETPELNAHSLMRPTTEPEAAFVERLKSSPPQIDLVAVAIEAANQAPDDYENTAIGCNPEHQFGFFFGADANSREARKMHEALKNKPLSLNVYLFSSSGLCFVYHRSSWQSLVLCEGDDPIFFDEDGDDTLDGEEEAAAYKERQEKAAALGQVLATAKGWGLCRNHQQRLYFAETLFADREGVENASLCDAVERANTAFEMEVLPEKVTSLHGEGKTAKEIASVTGCSQAKARRIIAQLAGKQSS